jgi:hypothetical protein
MGRLSKLKRENMSMANKSLLGEREIYFTDIKHLSHTDSSFNEEGGKEEWTLFYGDKQEPQFIVSFANQPDDYGVDVKITANVSKGENKDEIKRLMDGIDAVLDSFEGIYNSAGMKSPIPFIRNNISLEKTILYAQTQEVFDAIKTHLEKSLPWVRSKSYAHIGFKD